MLFVTDVTHTVLLLQMNSMGIWQIKSGFLLYVWQNH